MVVGDSKGIYYYQGTGNASFTLLTGTSSDPLLGISLPPTKRGYAPTIGDVSTTTTTTITTTTLTTTHIKNISHYPYTFHSICPKK